MRRVGELFTAGGPQDRFIVVLEPGTPDLPAVAARLARHPSEEMASARSAVLVLDRAHPEEGLRVIIDPSLVVDLEVGA